MLIVSTREVVAVAVLWLVAFSATGAASEVQAPPGQKVVQVGAFAIDITPNIFPVIVNGMFEERTADRAVDPLFARAFVLDDGATRLAIVVVDNLMLPRELLDEVKSRAAELTGIPVDRMLISATHTHSAPSAMACLGSRTDPNYPAFLIPKIARAIQLAQERLQPAQIGWAKIRAPQHTFCRRYIRRPDRLINDPFGRPNVRANMHPGYQSPDVVGPSGPVDDELSLVAMQTADGKPLAVLANFSMHYIGSPMVSADYFGRFAQHLSQRIDGSDGTASCIVAMSQGTSGDLMGMNYSAPAAKLHYDRYADELAELAAQVYRQVQYHQTVPLAIREAKLTLERRVPDAERLAWAKTLAATVGDRLPRGHAEVYAFEQIALAAEPQRELKLQAVRIGDVGIAAIPNEVFGITGLKLKLQSPLPVTFNIELANGADGYIPPPEQHKLGGYTTWPARSAGLEVDAEPKIVETLLTLLEEVAGKPRRPIQDAGGRYAEAVLQSKPRAFWRLSEIAGDVAADASGHGFMANYEDGIARYLPGPTGDGFSAGGEANRAAHFAGGRLRAKAPDMAGTYSVEFWFWNALPNDARPVTGVLFSRGTNKDDVAPGEHLALGGSSADVGLLVFVNSNQANQRLIGKTTIEPRSWNHIVLVREGPRVRVHLNGRPEPEIVGEASAIGRLDSAEWYFGGRSDNDSNLEGKLDEVAIYDRALSTDEVALHYQAAGVATDPVGMKMKTEPFDRDPGWLGVNNRIAQTREPIEIRQDFGFSAKTGHAGGQSPGEIGGFITPAGEAAFYGKAIEQTSLDGPLSASGTMSIGQGGTNLLLGFFNADSVNEWRTPNTLAMRLNARGDFFFAYVEYCTSKWRAGGDTTPFPAVTDPETGRWNLIGYPCNKSLPWTLAYDPAGNDGKGVVTATIGQDKAVCKLDASHKADGAAFNRFGILNVVKSADSGSEVWLDDIAIRDGAKETFDRDPQWDGRNNRHQMKSRLVRPWFDFGFSNTNFARGRAPGELGGQIFRGDCREAARMACYGDRLQPLTLDQPLKASGKVVMRRGVSDSTTLFGFYNSADSMRQNESQKDGLPESVVGIHIEGPSSEGFFFYPVLRTKGGGSTYGPVRESPPIHPDGQSHDWTLEYNPAGAAGKGQVVVTLDEKSVALDLEDGSKAHGTTFDRFGIVTSWIDGNSQDVYWDDVSYTVAQE